MMMYLPSKLKLQMMLHMKADDDDEVDDDDGDDNDGVCIYNKCCVRYF